MDVSIFCYGTHHDAWSWIFLWRYGKKEKCNQYHLQSFIAMGVITVVWVVIGFGLAFGDSIGGIVGNPTKFLFFNNVGTKTAWSLAPTIPLILFAVFQMKFAIITPALISGAFAERIRFWGYLLFIILFSIFIYSPLAHAVWHPDGILFKYGVLDFAGGTVVHMSAGWAALAGALFLKREQKLYTT
jgi:Amt family ammonium transporter